MNARTGSIYRRGNVWYARVTFVDPVSGQRRDIRRKAGSKAAAAKRREALLAEIETTDGSSLGHEKKTFADFAGYYREHYLQPAVYVDGRKVSGLRSWYTPRLQVAMLESYFGATPLRTISYSHLRTLKARRLAEPTKAGTQRSIATVNRELTLLNRMFAVAVREGWMLRNPFAQGEPLVSIADERHRERILSPDEEIALLTACDHPQRQHLRPIIICALDTGMRQGEIFKLRWEDIDLEAGVITVQAFNTKTMRTREVGMTRRLAHELRQLAIASGRRPDAPVFGIRSNVKRSFDAARRAAGVADLRFHDLRHTAATRLVEGGLPLTHVGRILGHSLPKTTFRYVNATRDTAQRAAEILDKRWA